MVYCISDIHGQLDAFRLLLKKMKFNRRHDTLYILGDMVDWGRQSIEVVRYLMTMQVRYNCVKVLMGNHDFMFLKAIKKGYVDGVYSNNGGDETYRQFLSCSVAVQKRITNFLELLDYYVEDLKVGNNTFYLTHSAPHYICDDKEEMVWHRFNPEYLDMGSKILVFGHTITSYLWQKYHIPGATKNHVRTEVNIINRIDSGYIAIDCGGKVLERQGYNLGGICLDKLQEYYINWKEVTGDRDSKKNAINIVIEN